MRARALACGTALTMFARATANPMAAGSAPPHGMTGSAGAGFGNVRQCTARTCKAPRLGLRVIAPLTGTSGGMVDD